MTQAAQQSTVPAILAAMNAVQKALAAEGISKSRENKQQGYSFRGIDEVYNTVSRLHAENGILVRPRYSDRVVSERTAKGGGALFNVVVTGNFTFVSVKDGSELEFGPFIGEAMDSADKATNKAMSAAMKYAMLQGYQIPTHGDNDADSTTHEVAPQAPETLSEEQLAKARAEMAELGVNEDLFCKTIKVERLEDVLAANMPLVQNLFDKKRKKLAEEKGAKKSTAKAANDADAQSTGAGA